MKVDAIFLSLFKKFITNVDEVDAVCFRANIILDFGNVAFGSG